MRRRRALEGPPLFFGPPPETAAEGPQEIYAELPEIGRDSFADVFLRDNQIELVLSALRAAAASDFLHRFHVLLHGPPGCGKTEILRCVARAAGKAAYLFDETSTTKAGAEEFILGKSQLPRLLLVEEIEKTEEANLRWLLGVMDQRGEIRKTNVHGSRIRRAKMLLLATCNDKDWMTKALSGALYSRFPLPIHCPPPDVELMKKVLRREIRKVAAGDERWIGPCLEYALKAEGTTDLRRIVAICLSGRERWMDGSFPRLLRETMEPKRD